MQAEVLSVGTELLLGQTVNTDTTIVAKALSALGIDLLYAAVVGDNVGRLEKAVYDALDRSDILITTGGLGPTGDDLTKETVAAAAGKKLVLHEQSYQHLLDYFANGGMTENQMKQGMLPEGCTALKNDNARLRVPDGQGQDRHHAARPAFGIDPDAAQLCRAVP